MGDEVVHCVLFRREKLGGGGGWRVVVDCRGWRDRNVVENFEVEEMGPER